MATQANIRCPVCRTPKSTKYSALESQAVRRNGQIVVILPHEYAICENCYNEQFQRKYGMTREEAAVKKAAMIASQEGEDPLFLGAEIETLREA